MRRYRLGQIMPYARTTDAFASSEHWGANVAHHDLIEGVLANDAVEGVDVFVPKSSSDWMAAQWAVAARKDPRLRLLDCEELGSAVQTQQYVFLTGHFAQTVKLAEVRAVLGLECAFPICTLIHAVQGLCEIHWYLTASLLAAKCDRVVVTSEAGSRAMGVIMAGVRRFLAGQKLAAGSGCRTVEIPLGVNTDHVRPGDKNIARAALGIPSDRIVLLYVGRFTPQFKADLEPLLLSFARLFKRRPNLFLVLAGKDSRDYVGQLKNVAEAHGVSDHVKFLADFPLGRKALIYQAGDIFVSPVDNIQETFGLSILEAMAAGLPSVVSDWSGYRDLVIDGKTGFLVPTAWPRDVAKAVSTLAPLRHHSETCAKVARDTLVCVDVLEHRLADLIDDDRLRREMGANALEHVNKRYALRSVARRFEALWRAQVDEIGDSASDIPRLEGLSLDETFSHYASFALDSQVGWRVSPDAHHLVAAVGGPSPVGLTGAAMNDIFDSIAGGSGAEPDPAVLRWLAKKGYISGSRSPARAGSWCQIPE